MSYRYTASENAARSSARTRYGVNYLLAYDSDPKTHKSNTVSDKYYTVICYMAPAMVGADYIESFENRGTKAVNSCPAATPGCTDACLHRAGNPAFFKNKEWARIRRKNLYLQDRGLFLDVLRAELNFHWHAAADVGRQLAIRLNGTTDIVWETVAPGLFGEFSDSVFYDYTKILRRFGRPLPPNYTLVFSRSELNHSDCLEVLKRGGRVAAVFSTPRTKPLPEQWEGFPVVDQDRHDLIFTQPPSTWLGLRAKGLARRDTSGFVIQLPRQQSAAQFWQSQLSALVQSARNSGAPGFAVRVPPRKVRGFLCAIKRQTVPGISDRILEQWYPDSRAPRGFAPEFFVPLDSHSGDAVNGFLPPVYLG